MGNILKHKSTKQNLEVIGGLIIDNKEFFVVKTPPFYRSGILVHNLLISANDFEKENIEWVEVIENESVHSREISEDVGSQSPGIQTEESA